MPIPPPDNYPDDAEQRAIVGGLFRMVSSDGGGPLRMHDALQSPPAAVRTRVGRLLLLLGGIAVPDRATWMAMLDKQRNQVHALEETCRRAQAIVPPTEGEVAVINSREERLKMIADQHKLVSIWSVGGVEELDAPHPYPMATVMVHETFSGEEPDGTRAWGGDGGRFQASINGPRWVDLWIAADAAIQQSGDLHHRFVEEFAPRPDHPNELHLFCGS